MSCQTNTEAQNMRDREIMSEIEKAQKEMIDASIPSESMLQNGGANPKIVHAITIVFYAIVYGGSFTLVSLLIKKPDFSLWLANTINCEPGTLAAFVTDIGAIFTSIPSCADKDLLIAQAKVNIINWMKMTFGTSILGYSIIYYRVNSMLDTGTCDLFNIFAVPPPAAVVVPPGGSGKKYRKLRQQTKNNNLKSLRNKKLRSRKNKK
jgi:hypothetical protein